MEIEGHPTQDMIDELIRRGALPAEGSSTGPDIETLRFITERHPDTPGRWLFLPQEVFLTGLDDVPPE